MENPDTVSKHHTSYIPYLNWFFTLLILVWGFTMWITALLNYNNNDSVSLWSISREIPDMGTFDNALTQLTTDTALLRTKVIYTASAALVNFCVSPEIIMLMKQYQPVTKVPTNLLSPADATALDTSLAGVDFETWGIPLDQFKTPLDRSYTTHFLSPLCQCMRSVFLNFSDTTNSVDSSRSAFKACFVTQPLPARQVLAFTANEENPISRKSISRHGLLLVLCLALLINTAYNAIDFDAENYALRNSVQFVTIVISFFAIVLFPIANTKGATPAHLIKITSLLYIPGIFLEGFGIDYYALSWVYKQKRRTSFLHPFTFYTTLVTLSVLALIENGIYTIEAVVSCSFISHSVTLIYSAVLFFLHFHCGNWKEVEKVKDDGETVIKYQIDRDNQPFIDLKNAKDNVLQSYLLALLTVFLVCWNIIIPSFAVKADPNILWILPVVFIFLGFAVPVWVEHIFKEQEDHEDKLQLTSHWANLGYTFILLAVLLYFTIEWMFVRYGDSNYISGGQRMKILNFGLSLQNSNNMQYVIP
jgi:hypothetical protein